MIQKLFAIFLFFNSLAFASENIIIEIPKEKIDYAKTEKGLQTLHEKIVMEEKSFFLKEFVSIFASEITKEMQEILDSRDPDVSMDCIKTHCVLSNNGTPKSFDFEVQGQGKITLILAKKIVFKLRLDDVKELEICAIQGIRARKSGLTQNVNGGLTRLGDGVVEESFVDIGFGGGYPNSKCD